LDILDFLIPVALGLGSVLSLRFDGLSATGSSTSSMRRRCAL